jgi:hypothetical protein
MKHCQVAVRHRRDGEYQRRGAANVFCGVEPKAGQHFTRADQRNWRGSSNASWAQRLPPQLTPAGTTHHQRILLSSSSGAVMKDLTNAHLGR